MTDLLDKSAVVTGGSRGIGRAIVLRLAAEGARVFFTYRADEDAAHDVEQEASQLPGTARPFRLDLTAPEAGERLMTEAEHHLDGLDILVNNASASFTTAPLAETSETTFDAMLAANAKSAFHTIRYAARHMWDGGSIVNISTLNTRHPAPGNAPYVASKGALEQLSLVAAAELGARDITVNTVSPGATDTDLLRSTNPAEALTRVAEVTPLRRLGTPEDVADVVGFLVGPRARWLTGQNLNATGGLV